MIKVAFAVHDTHFTLVVFENLQQITHNVREKGDASKHNCQSSNHLYVAYRKVVSVTNRRQDCQREVYACHELDVEQWVVFVLFPHSELSKPGAVVNFIVIICEVHLGHRYSEPEAPQEKSDDKCDDDKSHDSVNVKRQVGLQNSFIVTGFSLKCLQNILDSSDIYQLFQSWHSQQTEQLEGGRVLGVVHD